MPSAHRKDEREKTSKSEEDGPPRLRRLSLHGILHRCLTASGVDEVDS